MPTAASAPSWPPEATSADPFTSRAAEAIEVAMQLPDAVVLVTGASAGIGRAAAAEVGGHALLADLAFPEERRQLAAEAIEVFGRSTS